MKRVLYLSKTRSGRTRPLISALPSDEPFPGSEIPDDKEVDCLGRLAVLACCWSASCAAMGLYAEEVKALGSVITISKQF